MNLLEIRQDILSILGQSSNSKAGQLPSGVGTTPDITTTQTLDQYINEGQADLARTSWPWEDNGTATVADGSRGVKFGSLTTDGGGVIFSASSVTWNGVSLRRVSRDIASIRFRTIETDANSDPAYWSEWELDGVLLFPWPADTEDVFVVGLATPPLLADDDDVPTFLPADQHKLLSYYGAWKIAVKNTQNDDLAPRNQIWSAMYNDGKQALYERAMKTQSSLAARLEMTQQQGK